MNQIKTQNKSANPLSDEFLDLLIKSKFSATM